MICVSLIEDDSTLRETLTTFVNRAEGLHCVGAFPNSETALASLPALKPDVVLVDIHLPGMSGIECVRVLKSKLPQTASVMLTIFEDETNLFDSLRAGASGYLLKRTPGPRIIDAIREAHLGGLPLSQPMAAKVSRYFHSLGKARVELEQLTPREEETLALLAQGLRYKEIAARLQIGFDTVREHVRHIYRKLHVSSRTEAVVRFLAARGT